MRHQVVLKFAPKVSTNVEEIKWHRTQSTWRTEDHSLMFEVDVDGIEEISWWVMSYGDQVEVVEPPELRNMIRSRVARMHEVYSNGR